MIPLTSYYDESIDQSKLCEQKKPAEYIVSRPSRGVGVTRIIKNRLGIFSVRNFFCFTGEQGGS